MTAKATKTAGAGDARPTVTEQTRHPKASAPRLPRRAAALRRAISLARSVLVAPALIGMAVAWGPPRPLRAGPWPVTRGAASLGRGGALMLGEPEPASLAINPAMLVDLPGLQAQVDAAIEADGRGYRPADGGPAVRNRWRGAPAPGAFVTLDLGLLGAPGVALGGGFFAPAHRARAWDVSGAQRFVEIDGDAWPLTGSLALATSLPFWQLHLGVAVTLSALQVHETRALQDDDPQARGVLLGAVDAVAGPLVGGVVAVSLAPLPWLRVGGSTTFAQDVQTAAQLTLDQVVQGAELWLRLPSIWRVSIEARDVAARFDVEWTAVWAGWGRAAAASLWPVPTQGQPGALGTPFALGLRDEISLHLGGAWQPWPSLALRLRGGLFYAAGAVAPAALSVAAHDLATVGAGVGARLALWRGLWGDVGVGYRHGLPTTVARSSVRAIDLQGGTLALGAPAADGSYVGDAVQVALAVGFAI